MPPRLFDVHPLNPLPFTMTERFSGGMRVAITLFQGLCTFAVAADVAYHAAALMLDDTAALRARAFQKGSLLLHFAAVGRQVGLNRLGHGIRTGQDLVFAKA